MNKGEFVEHVVKKYNQQNSDGSNLTKVMCDKVLNATLESIGDVLGRGDSITFVGFGSFSSKHYEERTGRNPQNGTPMKIPAHNRPVFKAGKKLKEMCNGL